MSKNDIPYGYCHCGCGEKTTIAKNNHKRSGHVRGQPVKYVKGHNSYRPLAERFWERVDKRGPDECWLWEKPNKYTGYGQIGKDNTYVGAHRVSYELHNGPIPDGLFVCHHCDVRSCCNPAHLFLGTQKDNIADCKNKGRNFTTGEKRQKGEDSSNCILTASQVLEIRERAAGGEPHASIAGDYGVTRGAVYRIDKRLNWKHI